jgi:hypothetical protein
MDIVSSKPKCEFCQKRYVSFVNSFSCRCAFKSLCVKCRLPEAHCCSFDWKDFGRKILIEQNPVIVNSKLEKI